MQYAVRRWLTILHYEQKSHILDRFVNIVDKMEHTMKLVAARTQEMVFFRPLSIKSKRNNRFYALPYTHGKKEFKRVGPMFTMCVPFYLNHHLWIGVAGTYDNENQGCFFSHHLFDRYVQRCIKEELDVGMIECALRFCANNMSPCSRTFIHPKTGEKGRFMRTNDGIALGAEIDGVCVYMTFVTEQMLFDGQQQLNSDTKVSIEDMNTTFYEIYSKKRVA